MIAESNQMYHNNKFVKQCQMLFQFKGRKYKDKKQNNIHLLDYYL